MTIDAIAEAFVDGFERSVRDDDHIVAAYVANLPPWEYGDRYMDVQLVVACRHDDLDGVNGDLPSIAGAIQSIVWDHRQWPWPLHVVTDSGLEVEFYIYRATLGRWAKPVARILKQAPDFFRPPTAVADEDPGVRPGDARHAVHAAETLWREVPDVLRALRHDELPFAYLATVRLLSRLLAVLSERAPRPMRIGSGATTASSRPTPRPSSRPCAWGR